MDAETFLTMAHDSWLGQMVRDISWMFAACEGVHFFGLCLVLGSMLLVDLRLMGVITTLPAQNVLRFSHVAAVGVALNAISGAAFFASNPTNYWNNPLFAAKMILVLLAVLNIVWFEGIERRNLVSLRDGVITTQTARVIGALSLTLWTAIVILGRFLPLLGSG